jgi:hypothetical protein
VICQDHRGKITDECPMDQKPEDQQSCCHFKWRTRWKPCSVSCGTGYRAREQVCMRLFRKSESNPQPVKNGKQVDGKYCGKLKMKNYKVQTKICTRQCEFKWDVSSWSKVSLKLNKKKKLLTLLTCLWHLFTVFCRLWNRLFNS